MVDKYISILNGVDTQVAGTVTGGTVAENGKIVALDTTGRLDASLMPVGIGADTASLTAFETLSAGAFVYVRPDGTVANASANNGGNAAVGFVLSAVDTGNIALVYFEGRNTALTGLTPGGRVYLSDTTSGGVTQTPVVGAGKKHQYLGNAISATSLSFEGDDYVVLA